MSIPDRSTITVEQLRELAPALGVSLPTDLFRDEPIADGVQRTSRHLEMKDGTRIAADIWLPPGAVAGRVSTVIRTTRYWRARVGDPIAEHMGNLEVARWTALGCALVLLDQRGTGASFGQWLRPLDDLQQSDLYEAVDWIVAQSWSNGSVVGQGISYDGATAQLLASTGHPAVKAAAPLFAHFDNWAHVVAPGGLRLTWFLETWGALAWTLDGYPERGTKQLPVPIVGSVRLVDDDPTGDLLAAAVAEHADNWELWDAVRLSVHRGQAVGADGIDADAGMPLARIDQLRKARVPMWLWSSWFDGTFAAAQLAQLADPDLDVRVTIGPFSHGAGHATMGDPMQPELTLSPTPPERHLLVSQFLRHHMGERVPDPSPGRLRYWTLGRGWSETDTWPPAGVRPEQLWLCSDGRLSDGNSDESLRTYDVDFEVTTGSSTRWHTLIGGSPVVYADRRHMDARLLIWEGEPLPSHMEIAGSPVAELHLAISTSDAAVHLYLETVAPDGKVTYLTEGQLRLLHRKVSEAPYEALGPWHSCREEDAAPMQPGVQETVLVTFSPVAAAIPGGHRIRVALAGADCGVFERVPEQGPVTFSIAGTSCITLPRMPYSSWSSQDRG